MDKIKVGYKTFKLIFEKAWGEGERQRRSVGETHINSHNSVVYVDECRDKIEEVNTYIHELLHAIWHVYNIEEGDDEERIVTTMANGLVNVLVDNPESIVYIRDCLGDNYEHPPAETIRDSKSNTRKNKRRSRKA